MKASTKDSTGALLDFEQPIRDINRSIATIEASLKAGAAKGAAAAELASLKAERDQRLSKLYAELTPWQTVQVARHPDRPLLQDYRARLCEEFVELHGDRLFGDDHAIVGGFAMIAGHRVMLIGMEKGRNIDQKIVHNFGMANPEGYRKALRLMKLAESFSVPVVCLIDTPAAYPGLEAEARGQAEAIARNLAEMSSLATPIVVAITGEGGSGGALGLGVGDVVLMLSYAIYSVIPPEGCAAILWRDASFASQAAEALKITAPALLELGIIDEIVPEPVGGAHRAPDAAANTLRDAIVRQLKRLQKLSVKRLLEDRYEKFARIGKFDARKYASH